MLLNQESDNSKDKIKCYLKKIKQKLPKFFLKQCLPPPSIIRREKVHHQNDAKLAKDYSQNIFGISLTRYIFEKKMRL